MKKLFLFKLVFIMPVLLLIGLNLVPSPAEV